MEVNVCQSYSVGCNTEAFSSYIRSDSLQAELSSIRQRCNCGQFRCFDAGLLGCMSLIRHSFFSHVVLLLLLSVWFGFSNHLLQSSGLCTSTSHLINASSYRRSWSGLSEDITGNLRVRVMDGREQEDIKWTREVS